MKKYVKGIIFFVQIYLRLISKQTLFFSEFIPLSLPSDMKHKIIIKKKIPVMNFRY